MFDRKKMIKRYKIVAYAMVLVGIAILVKVVYIATVERSYWMDVAELLEDEHLKARNAFVEVDQPTAGKMHLVNTPLK